MTHRIISSTEKSRKIIHVDMDCFYAAIEMRDDPSLIDKPIAVGGSPEQRGVICTCNYMARQHGVRSAMSTAMAYRLCPQLHVLSVNMGKYKQVAKRIHAIFDEFTELVEPLSLDEAYLDVTDSAHYQGSATLIAKAIRQRIWQAENLIASAGVAPNKLLAKIASGWKKPDGLFIILPEEVTSFMQKLPVDELFGVGKVTAKKLHDLHLQSCADLQTLTLSTLVQQFGKRGQQLYEQCRGIDHRPVQPGRMRKSLSVEQTFAQDINETEICLEAIKKLYQRLVTRIQAAAPHHPIKNQYIKIKFSDFKLMTAETVSKTISLEKYLELFRQSHQQQKKLIRLLGLGVHFDTRTSNELFSQHSLF